MSGVTCSFGGPRVVDSVSFGADAGKVTALMGPNGAGKTSLLKVAAGLVRGGGSVLFGGEKLENIVDPWRRVAFVLEEGSFHPRRSARDHLRMIAYSNRLPRARVEAALAQVGLLGVADRPPGGYSLGMRQRLGIACALMCKPDIYVLDEPANGLDPPAVVWLRDLIRGLADGGSTVLMSSHLLAEVELIADQVVLLSRGRVVCNQTLGEFISQACEQVVHCRTLELTRLAALVEGVGGRVKALERAGGAWLEIGGVDVETVARVAFDNDVLVCELIALQPTLNEAFMSRLEGQHEFGVSASQS